MNNSVMWIGVILFAVLCCFIVITPVFNSISTPPAYTPPTTTPAPIVPKARPTALPQKPVEPISRTTLLITAGHFQFVANQNQKQANEYSNQAKAYLDQAMEYLQQANEYPNQANRLQYQYNKYMELSATAGERCAFYERLVDFNRDQADKYTRMAQDEE